MNKYLQNVLLLMFSIVLINSPLFAKVSSRDTNVDVIAPGKAMYGLDNNGGPVRMMEIDSNGLLEFDNGAVGASFSGALTIDGVSTFSGDPTFSSSTTLKPIVLLKNTNADATSSELKLQKDSASPADNDDLGRITAYGDDSTGTADKFFEMRLESTDVTTANEDAKAIYDLLTAGTSREYLSMGDAAVVINEDSIDMDVRIESDNNANAFFFDGTNGKIGINNNAPDNYLHIIDGSLRLETTAGNGTGQVFIFEQGDFTPRMYTYSNDTNATVDLRLKSAGSAIHVFKHNGYVGFGVTDPDAGLEVSTVNTQLKLSYDASTYVSLEADVSGNYNVAQSDGTNVQRVSVSLADDEEVALPAGTGYLEIFVEGDNEFGLIHISDDGTVAKVSTLNSVAIVDEDGALSVYDAGSVANIKNRLGSSKTVVYEYMYK